MLRWTSLLLFLGLASCTGATHKDAAKPLPPSSAVDPSPKLMANPMLPPKVYTDGVGLVVEVVPLIVADGSEAQALLRVSGVRNIISGVTFLANRTPTHEKDAWTIDIGGRTLHLLQLGRKRSGRSPIQLLLPQTRGTFLDLSEKPDAAKFVDIDELINDYKSHLRDGSLEELAKFDHEFARKNVVTRMNLARRALAKTCGKTLDVAMNWETLSKRDDYAKAHFCNSAVAAISQLCKMSVANKTRIKKDIEHVRCHLSNKDELSFRYQADTKTLNVSATASALQDLHLTTTMTGKTLGIGATLLKSSNGVYVVIPPLHDPRRGVYVGFGPKLYKQWLAKSKARTLFSMWSPMSSTGLGLREPGKWKSDCSMGEVWFDEVTGKERDRVLGTFTLEAPMWEREPRLLARDSKGMYFYVDTKRDELGGLDFRVYKGLKGGVAPLQMVDVVADAKGRVLSTTAGTLRVGWSPGNTDTAQWIARKKTTDLTIINVFTELDLVYEDLGVYEGLETGTLCSFANSPAK